MQMHAASFLLEDVMDYIINRTWIVSEGQDADFLSCDMECTFIFGYAASRKGKFVIEKQ